MTPIDFQVIPTAYAQATYATTHTAPTTLPTFAPSYQPHTRKLHTPQHTPHQPLSPLSRRHTNRIRASYIRHNTHRTNHSPHFGSVAPLWITPCPPPPRDS